MGDKSFLDELRGVFRSVFSAEQLKAVESNHFPQEAESLTVELLLVSVLLELALSDGALNPTEYEFIFKFLCEDFSFSEQQASELIGKAKSVLKELPSADLAALRLHEQLSEKERSLVVELLREVLAADGRSDPREEIFLSRMERLLKSELH